MAKNAREAILKEKKQQVDGVWVDKDWESRNNGIGFDTRDNKRTEKRNG